MRYNVKIGGPDEIDIGPKVYIFDMELADKIEKAKKIIKERKKK